MGHLPLLRPGPDIICKDIWKAAALLLANFPVAAGVILAAIAIETRYTVVVSNESAMVLKDAKVFGGGVDVSLGSLRPQASIKRSFYVVTDGRVMFRAISGDQVHSTLVDGYVTNGMGGNKVIEVHSNGDVEVIDKDT